MFHLLTSSMLQQLLRQETECNSEPELRQFLCTLQRGTGRTWKWDCAQGGNKALRHCWCGRDTSYKALQGQSNRTCGVVHSLYQSQDRPMFSFRNMYATMGSSRKSIQKAGSMLGPQKPFQGAFPNMLGLLTMTRTSPAKPLLSHSSALGQGNNSHTRNLC